MAKGLFDVVNDINFKTGEWDEETKKLYAPYMINRALSWFGDTVQYANLMNQNSHLDPKLQYDFLQATIKKGKRFSKWHKKHSDEDIDRIKDLYHVNEVVASEYLDLINSIGDIKDVRDRLAKGGKK
jgi:hypothetical protein